MYVVITKYMIIPFVVMALACCDLRLCQRRREPRTSVSYTRLIEIALFLEHTLLLPLVPIIIRSSAMS